MAKLGTYSYPDIRFSDAVEIAGRIMANFRGTVTVKGLAWELGMAENSGTLFAKVAALRDFGLVEGRGELRVSALTQRILHPNTPEEGRKAKADAFRRVDLLQSLYERLEGEAPDDKTLMIALEEITRAPREEIVRRFTLIQKHLSDAARVLGRFGHSDVPVYSGISESTLNVRSEVKNHTAELPAYSSNLFLDAGDIHLSVPLTVDYVDAAISLLRAFRVKMADPVADMGTA